MRKPPHWPAPAVAFIDMLFSIAVSFMAMALLYKTETPPVQMQDRQICAIAIDITWDTDSPADVDLWVKSPGDDTPVGFRRKNGKIFDLVRDDMGLNDPQPKRSERSCGRLLPDGEYVVALVLYDTHGAPLPVPVHISVSLVDPSTAIMTEIFTSDYQMRETHTETTAVRFTLSHGALVDTNRIPVKLGVDEL